MCLIFTHKGRPLRVPSFYDVLRMYRSFRHSVCVLSELPPSSAVTEEMYLNFRHALVNDIIL